jgi:SAM-dependent methyltransferase
MLDRPLDHDSLRFEDRATRARFDRVEAWLLARLRGRRCALDLACGTGRLSTHIPADSVVGLDISKEMLATARQRGLAVVRGDGNALPFASGTFDGG